MAATFNNKLRLIYFDIGGKGEPIRLLCRYLGIDLVDDRLGLALEGSNETNDKDFLGFVTEERFPRLKESGVLPFGQVPVLVVPQGLVGNSERFVIAQCHAIMRFIAVNASKLGATRSDISSLYISGSAAAANIDALLDAEADAFAGIRVARYRSRFGFDEAVLNDAAAAQATENCREDVMPRHLAALERFAERSTTSWLAGTEGPSIADFVWALALKGMTEGFPAASFRNILTGYPKLQAAMDSFYAEPTVQSYYQQ